MMAALNFIQTVCIIFLLVVAYMSADWFIKHERGEK